MKIYLVGGAVRDTLLGLPIKERDYVVVGSSPQEMLSLGFKQVGRDFPVFLHPITKEEYALARTERKTGKGYLGFQCFFSPKTGLVEDLKRRDLTINAMAMDEKGQLLDPYKGKQDLEKKILRHVSVAFIEDPLRILRVARFAARFYDFKIAPPTLRLMKNMALELEYLVPERVWQEWLKAFSSPAPWRFFKILKQIKALSGLFPEISRHYVKLQKYFSKLSPFFKENSPNEISSKVAFGIIFYHIPYQPLLDLFARYRIPKYYQRLAKLIHAFKNLPPRHSLEDLLFFLEKLDLYRNDSGFEESFVILARIIPKKKTLLGKCQRFFKITKGIKLTNQELIDLTNKEIKPYLHQKRLQSMQENTS